MTTSTHPDVRHRRGTWPVTVAVLVLAAPALGVATLAGALAMGWLGVVLPAPLGLGVLYLYRATTRSTHSVETRAATREVGAVALALTCGVGAWICALIAGVWFGIVPLFDSHLVDYPHETAWMAGSSVLSLALVPAAWWLLRRFADDRLGGVPPAG